MKTFTGVVLVVWLGSAGAAFAQTCGGMTANPEDWYPDDAVLQCLLDAGTNVPLTPNFVGPGYIIARGLRVKNAHTMISSNNPYFFATLLAAPSLGAACILESGTTEDAWVDNTVIFKVRFDGNRDARNYTTLCTNRRNTGQVELRGNNHWIGDSQFVRTMCGGALAVEGSNFTVEGNLFSDLGFDRNRYPHPWTGFEPWADGIRSETCIDSNIWYNTFTDYTDVGVSLGSYTSNCKVTNNTFQQFSKWAFAATGFPNGTHYRSEITSNTVQGNGLMSFGLAIGARPWGNSSWVYGGSVTANIVSGTHVNLNAEDIMDTYINGNTLSDYRDGAQCTPNGQGTNCNVYNASGVMQPGCAFLATFDNNCLP